MTLAPPWAMAALATAVFLGAAEPRPLVLGLVAPRNEAEAASLVRGVQLAVEEANGAAQPPVRLEIRSENGQWGSVGNDAVFLVTERHVDAIIASADGADTHLILQVSGRMRVPVVSLCTDTSITAAGIPWAMRIVPSTDRQAEALFTALRANRIPATRWCAVLPPGRAARVVRHDLDAAAKATASTIARAVEWTPQTSVADLTKTILESDANAVLLWVSPAQAGALAAALRAHGYRGRLAGPCALASSAFLEVAKNTAVEVLVAAFHTDGSSLAASAAFSVSYRQRFGVDPDCTAAAAHDAARVLIDSLRETRPRDAYRAFPVTREISGVTGTMHFDAAGNRVDPLMVVAYRNGGWVAAVPSDR